MFVSRRSLLRSAAGAFAGTTTPLLDEFSQSSMALHVSEGLATGLIRLDRNENPYGPPDKAIQAIRSNSGLTNRYPTGEYEALTEKLASVHKVKCEQIILGAGSREILRMAATRCLSPGSRLVLASPTFGA